MNDGNGRNAPTGLSLGTYDHPPGTPQTAVSFMGYLVTKPTNSGDSNANVNIGFNVPTDYVSSGSTQLLIHFVTVNNTGNGSVGLGVLSQFVAPTGTIVTPSFNYNATIPVTSSPSATSYNYYVVTINLTDVFAADYFAYFGITRTTIGSTDTVNGNIYITSIEFRY